MRLILFILAFMISGIVSAQEYYLFLGTYTNKGKSEGLYVYRFNSQTGDFKKISTTASVNPSYVVPSNGGKYLFVANETGGKDPGQVSSFSFDAASGKLQFINKQESGGDDPCYVSIDATNKWVAIGNYSGGNLSIYPLQADGSLGKAVQTIQHPGKSHVHSVVFTPDHHYLVVTDLGLDQLSIYDFDPSKSKPLNEQARTVSTKQGAGPRHIIFHKKLPFAYTIEELSGNVSAYAYKNGELTPLQTVNSHPADFKGEIGSAAIRISPDGKFVYASNRGASNTLSIFAIDQQSGKLVSKGFQKTLGENPRDFNIDPTGNFLLVANEKTGNVVVFRRDKKTGLLKATGKTISVPEPVNLVFLY